MKNAQSERVAIGPVSIEYQAAMLRDEIEEASDWTSVGIARVLSGEPREPLFAVQSSNAPTDEMQARQGADAPVEDEQEQDVLK